MIVKKPYMKVKCEMWNKTTEKYDLVTTKTYIGYFLFGIIPVYLILINEVAESNGNKLESFVNIYEKYLIKSI